MYVCVCVTISVYLTLYMYHTLCKEVWVWRSSLWYKELFFKEQINNVDILTCFSKLNVYSLIFFFFQLFLEYTICSITQSLMKKHPTLKMAKGLWEVSWRGICGSVRLGSLHVLLGGEACWQPPSAPWPLCCGLWRWLLSVHQGSLGSGQPNQNRVADHGNAVWQCN